MLTLLTLTLASAGVAALISAAQPAPYQCLRKRRSTSSSTIRTAIWASTHRSTAGLGRTWRSRALTIAALLDIVSRGRLQTQGLTQLFFESAEPSFDELDPKDFLRRFPEGRYEIRAARRARAAQKPGRALTRARRSAEILESGMPAAEDCDVPLPRSSGPSFIDWDPVTTSHPEIGKSGPGSNRPLPAVRRAEGVKLSLELPPTVTEFEVPPA